MSKSGSRYGRRSNWFKIHCLLQEQQQSQMPMLPSKSKGWEGLSFPGKNLTGCLDIDNNNSASVKDAQDRSISPMMLPPGYGSAETAAAIWAARSSLLPVHPHPSGLPFFPPSFLQNPTFHHHPPPPNFPLLPFLPLRPPPPDNSPAVLSDSSSSPSPSPTERRSMSVERSSSSETLSFDKSLAVFRSLGPMQESPMDLSCRNSMNTLKSDKNLGEFEIQDQNSNIVGVSEESNSKEAGEDVFKKIPLDLTCSKS